MQGFAESILSLNKSIGHIRNEMVRYYEKELEPLCDYISAKNKKASQKDWWVEVTGFDVNVSSHGTVHVNVLDHYKNRGSYTRARDPKTHNTRK